MNKDTRIGMAVLFLLSILVSGCSGEYVKAEATIVDLKVNYPEKGIHTATIEYEAAGTRYTDEFKISVETLINDSISTPAPGIKFEILYEKDNPERTKIDYQVKPVYTN